MTKRVENNTKHGKTRKISGKTAKNGNGNTVSEPCEGIAVFVLVKLSDCPWPLQF